MEQKMFVLIFVFLFLCGCVGEEVVLEAGLAERQGQVQAIEADFVQGQVYAIEPGFVERVVDGDTFVLEGGERVRLIGIDAPEKGMPCSQEAEKRLAELVLGQEVFLARDISHRDKYGRLVRHVFAKGVFVNLAIVEEGLAVAFDYEPDTSKSEIFRKAEEKAREKKGCLWRH